MNNIFTKIYKINKKAKECNHNQLYLQKIQEILNLLHKCDYVISKEYNQYSIQFKKGNDTYRCHLPFSFSNVIKPFTQF